MSGGKRRVVIVGGGVVGMCVAWYARADGHEVVVLERGPEGRDCCSVGNAGLIVPSHVIPLASPGARLLALRSLLSSSSPLRAPLRFEREYLRWGWRFWRSATRANRDQSGPALRDLLLLGRRAYESLAESWNNAFRLQRNGLLVLCASQKTLDEEAHAAAFVSQLGIPAHVLNREQTAALEPGLYMPVAGAIHYPLDSHLVPMRLLDELATRVQRAGAEIRWSTPVIGWRTDGKRVRSALLLTGEVEGDEFVLAGGAWSQQLARKLGLYLPLQAGKGYSITLPRPRVHPTMGLILSEARVAVTPMHGALRFAGTMEFAGLDLSIDARRVAAMIGSIPSFLPDISVAELNAAPAWTGLRPCSPDGLPYIGRSRMQENLLVATGHAMMGVSLAPATGLVITDLIAGRQPACALDRFAPDRFDRRR